jgi:hypothetical protein
MALATEGRFPKISSQSRLFGNPFSPAGLFLDPIANSAFSRSPLHPCYHFQTTLPKGGQVLNFFRGVLMLLAAGFAAWRGWKIHHGMYMWIAYALAAAALALAAWHFTRKDDARRS